MRSSESGNILFIILIAIFLIGSLTAVIMSSDDSESATIDDETLVIRASEVQRYASELERAVRFITQNGFSESDIRFAATNAPSAYGSFSGNNGNQIFSKDGGGASYRSPPDDINDGSGWEFYGGTAVPGVGSDRADLVAVLPNVTRQFCDRINKLNGQPLITPTDSGAGTSTANSAGDCIFMDSAAARFGGSATFYSSPNTMDDASFTQDPNTSSSRPALQACVQCARDSEYHFYHVILAR